MSSTSRGLAPREGLELLALKMGRTRPSMEPRHGPQAGKSGYPRSQNADSSPPAQGALGLGFEAKPKGKGEAPRALIACGLGRRVALDGTWASPVPHAASITAKHGGRLLLAQLSHHCPLRLSSACSFPVSLLLPFQILRRR